MGNTVSWYENDGNENFTKHNISTVNNPEYVYAADIDKDGDIDVIAAFYKAVVLYENDGNENFTAYTIETSETDGAYSIYVIDINGDEKLDIVSTFWNDKVIWSENFGDSNINKHPIISSSSSFNVNENNISVGSITHSARAVDFSLLIH